MSATEKILVRGVNWLGDAVMTTPALQRLREARPKARITLLTPEKLADLWHGQPYLDEVITFTKEENVATVAKRLREKKFTAAVAFPNSLRTALEMWLARIPQRIGIRRSMRGPFLTHPLSLPKGAKRMHKRSEEEIKKLIEENAPPTIFSPTAHHSLHYLHLVTALGASAKPIAPRIVVNDWAVDEVRGRFRIDSAPDHPWFGLNPGAEYGPAKRWPAEYFIETANRLQKQTGCRWLIFGAPADQPLTELIAKSIAGTTVVNLAGKTNLRELAAAMKLCRLLISNDTGPTHLAAALGTPVVVPYGSTSPEMTGPFMGVNAKILRQPVACAPCFLRECPIDFRCLKRVNPERAIAAALELHEIKP